MSDKSSKPSGSHDGVLSRTFLENIGQLKSYLGRFFSSSHDIEDILQDTYIKAVEAEKRYTINTPKAFLYKVSKNLALNYHDRAAQKLTDGIEDFDSLEVLFKSISLEDQFEQEDRFQQFCLAAKQLPPKCRKVFILKKVYGLSNSEIAERLNISISTVDKHLAKGLLQCREELQRRGVEFNVASKKGKKISA
ncbi:RNA polymerase sigma factor [Pseudoteredinibacter isoporae]|uniref:RNA polymerase sigma-70 factor (ECF subfamily) n=1 Tax=Pseudoteredinibacter isoporae TaxID=570281 RepID=A0A7X0JUK9_9GAMM|nr:RNA polymerase sigma factor [Pseudoteredinibacter isoporae]MBB6522538.1 RNA polymerase sigma-70 factor (ECF subfamily) [Pseudoteredinibacter isoporae]NHO88068.1 RNA polymerase sigma factor [Pseudoteredinibacter isoporae]NIB23601.1 RNA polymerase sigma factor [Pseudoteredinibacter isoporae]